MRMDAGLVLLWFCDYGGLLSGCAVFVCNAPAHGRMSGAVITAGVAGQHELCAV
jgi:hypothetical protein